MLGAGLIAFFFAKFRDLPGKGNGAVFAARAAHRDGQLAFAPVSYTHLDVYKRQAASFCLVSSR